VAIALVCLVGVTAAVLAIVLSPGGGGKSAVSPEMERSLVMKLAAMKSRAASGPQQRNAMLLRLQPFARALHVKPAQLEQMVALEALVLKAREEKAQASEPAMLNITHTLPLSMSSTPAPASRGPLGQVEDVSFLNPKHGFLVSFSSTELNTGTALIEASRDGGANWATVWSRAHTRLSWIGFADARHGFATGIASPSASTERPLLLSSSDGGRSWRAVTPSLPASPHGSWTMTTARGSWPGELQFLSGRVGFAEPNPDNVWDLSGPPILRTGDGGRHWTVVSTPGVTFTAVDFLDSERGFATGLLRGRRARSCGSGVFSTADSGRHWRLLSGSCRSYPLASIDALNAGSIFAGGGRPYDSGAEFEELIGTSDGGKSWRSLSRGSAGNPIVTLRFFDTRHGLAASGGCHGGANGPCGGQVLVTSDGGRSWKTTAVTAGQIDLAGTNDAWVAPPCQDTCDVIFRSHDRGRSWQPVARPENDGLGSVQAVGTALLLTSSAGTFRSTDDGKTWRPFTAPTPPGAGVDTEQPVVAVPGLVASLSGTARVSVSRDGGQSWHATVLPVSKGNGLAAVVFADSLHGLAAEEGSNCLFTGELDASRLFATSDGGKSWQTLPTPNLEIEQLAAVPGLFVAIGGGAVCGQPLIGISRDGGRSWTLRSLPKNASCSPRVAAPETVWLSCGDYLLTSSDGGSSWNRLVKRHLSLTSAVPTPGNAGWLVRQVWGAGDSSIATLWRSGDGGRTWVEHWPALPIVGTSDKR
jgi:photosystem II stability/assembly factor-like uncharacterized protein